MTSLNFGVLVVPRARPIALSSTKPPTDPADEDELEATIRRNPCYVEYKALEECLLKTDRAFAKCQKEIKLLSACNRAKSKAK
mmetsp:Transcript_41598/g.93860  ORF Transcript_41598/g.93860 Transcript_41598/m.93860 type:complete len:83 (+) Transcript_41598:69-317(+)